MCLGIPMQVISAEETSARWQWDTRLEDVSLALTGPVQVGQHVLVYLGSAIRLLSAKQATQIANALQAVDNAAKGESFDHLIDREPQLPPHLREQQAKQKKEKICHID